MSLDDFPELGKLTPMEKILLIGDLWESITPESSSIPIPDSHMKELEKRLTSLQMDHLLTWEELKNRVDKRL